MSATTLPAIGSTVRFALYSRRGVEVVTGPVVKLRHSRKNPGTLTGVTVDLTEHGAGLVVVSLPALEVVR